MNNKQLNLKQESQENPNPILLVAMKEALYQPDAIIEKLAPNGQPAMVFERENVSTLVLNPKEVLTARKGRLTRKNAAGEVLEEVGEPIRYLKKVYQENQQVFNKVNGQPSFQSGLIGYFSYDFARYADEVRLKEVDDNLGLEDFDLLLTDIVVNYDRKQRVLYISQPALSENKAEQEAQKEALLAYGQELQALSKEGLSVTAKQKQATLNLKHQFTVAEFDQRVQKAKEHIIQGDIFQLILSNPLTAKNDNRKLLLHQAENLRKTAKSPYHAYFQDGDFSFLSGSPETLIKKSGELLYSYPLAGTRRRGKDAEEEARFEKELRTSVKEQAEHNMLIDLGRNDLGRISQFGTVEVTAYQNLLKFPNVMHLGSVVESQALPNLNPIDAILATLPAGTLSGAPKISAMTIINELEGRKRGLYGGGIGLVGFDGDFDLCIGIRSAYQKKDQLVLQSGAGIVADSDAKEEYQEFTNKGALLMNLLKGEGDVAID
ncbi:anthranilate synthase component I family protein [Fructobacillus durionis]|uniref:anthranilate synthase n=1 Tax=Fructobacillus durionis TaxID=283737 RepID=A0A1I1FNU5_9LACO|nr:anthranilate synthase component I family protein [Fructobacillus durionis]SFC00995.1 anthranilate synthase component 1 [Fructobacillus durionis]